MRDENQMIYKKYKWKTQEMMKSLLRKMGKRETEMNEMIHS